MNSLKRAVKYQYSDLIKSAVTFWLVILFLDIVSYLSFKYSGGSFIGITISGFTSSTEPINWFVTIAGSNLLPIFVFLIVHCYIMYYEHFPVALNFSVTRSDFYASALIDNISAALIFSAVQSILMKADAFLMGPMENYVLFYNNFDNIPALFISLFICFLFIMSFVNFLAAMNYKYGYKLWIVIGALFVLLSMSSMLDSITLSGIIDSIFTTKINPDKALKLMIAAAALYLGGYPAIYFAEIKSRLV